MKRLTHLLIMGSLLCILAGACAAPNTPTPPSRKEALCEYVNYVMEKRNRDILEARREGSGLAFALEPIIEWKVGTTSISRLTEEQKRMLLGETTEDSSALLLGDSSDNALLLSPARASGDGLPLKFDWRQHEDEDWTTPIRDQGLCKSCVAHAAVAVMESLLEIAAGNSHLNPDLSEQYVFLKGGGKSCDKGWNAGKAAEFLVAHGVPDEDCWPYDTGNLDPAKCCEDLETRLVKAKSFRRLRYEEIKSSLVENGPVLARFDVHEDIDCYKGGVYRQVIINRRGGHVVAIVGYDDVQGCWIVKNSWGPEWGEAGWLRIGYNEAGIDSVVYEVRLF